MNWSETTPHYNFIPFGCALADHHADITLLIFELHAFTGCPQLVGTHHFQPFGHVDTSSHHKIHQLDLILPVHLLQVDTVPIDIKDSGVVVRIDLRVIHHYQLRMIDVY